MKLTKILCTLALLVTCTTAHTQLVSSEAELNSAINGAVPGAIITLADGTWNNIFIDLDKNGTAVDPIIITAQNPGAVLMTGNSRAYMEGAYLTLSGLIFQDPSNLVNSGGEIEPVIELKRCNNCKVLNNKIENYNGTEAQKSMKFKWVLADGRDNEIAYNSFIGKYGVGSIINDNRNSSDPDYLKIHHNYFADRTPINEVNQDNDQDAIRIGNSSTSLDDSFSEVYDNYFHNFFGEVEVISNKSGQNKYYNNTFRAYSGTLTLRHGNNCEVHNNFFFAEENTFSGGVRVIGEGHRVYNNYIEGVNSRKPDGSTSNATGGINVSNGRPNTAINGYYQVKDCQVINNTFVNCDFGLRIGTTVSSDLDLAPQNLTVANNIMYNSSKEAYQIITEPTGASRSEGNLTTLSDDSLEDDGTIHRLTIGSAPINAGLGSYAFLTEDIFGGVRDASFDAGAEEFGANGERQPYDALDVGVSVGFGTTSSPTLAAMPLTVNFSKYAETRTFEIISNVDWAITNDIPWLSLDIESGTGTTIISASVTENNTGLERTGSITINETAGGNDLSTEVSIIQILTFIPSEITIVGTSSLGMQDKDEVSEENAYDDDKSSYWTGDPDTEAEVSITFDLNCPHVLTQIGINFWKAEERTTTFSIAVADDNSGPYTTIIDSETSADTGVTVDTEQLYSLGNTTARYVKFTGIGNSSSSNWTSIANVNIYGDTKCSDGTAVFENTKANPGVTLSPVPATDNILKIQSSHRGINRFEIYNVSGQKVMSGHGNNSYIRQIDISILRPGIYFIKLENIGVVKFSTK